MSQNAPQKKSPAASHMLWFFVLPCVAFILWASWGLVGALLEPKPQDIPSRLEAVQKARSSGDRWQAVYSLSQELQRMRTRGEWKSMVSAEQKEMLFATLAELKNEHANDLRLKKYVILTLGQFGDYSVVPFIREDLNEKDPELRFYAAWAFLGVLGQEPERLQEEDFLIIESWLADEDPALRKVASTFLVQHRQDEDWAAIRSLLNDEDQEVRWNTAVALASVGDESAVARLKEMFDLEQIRNMGLRSVDDLRHLMASANEAAYKLESDEVFEARQRLIEQVRSSTPEGRAILEALNAN